jgi:hypothetical protein
MRSGNAALNALAWITVVLAVPTPAVRAAEPASLLDLPVSGTAIVAASQYRDAASHAARGGLPVEIALAVAGSFEGKQQLIVQTHESAESPSASRVTVIRDGLLDDAVRSERWDVALARTPAGIWEIGQVTRSWRCWRGGTTTGFAAEPCP